MLCVLQIALRGDRVARRLRIARKLQIFLPDMMAVPRIFTSGPLDS